MTRLVWRCRRCSTFFLAERADLDPESALQLRIDAPKKSARIATHDCGGGAFGVADLAGAVPEASQ